MIWDKEDRAGFTHVTICQQDYSILDSNPLAAFFLSLYGWSKSKFYFFFFFFKSIHDGIDLKFLKRWEICPLTLLGPWILSDRLNLLHKHHISELFAPGTCYESSKFDLSYLTLTGQMNHMVVFPVLNGGMCKHIWCKYSLVETEMSVSVNTSLCDSEICSPLHFWPVKLDNSKVLRKQRQRDVNVAKVTLLQIWMNLISVKAHIKSAVKLNLF